MSAIHKGLRLKHGRFQKELPEQEMAVAYLTGDENVLEIGGNIGRNSLVIDSLQKGKSGKLVVVESDPEIAAKLKENKKLNAASFQIVVGALSKTRMFQSHWRCVKTDVSPGAGYKEVPIVDYGDIRGGTEFDTLVVDCEGCIGSIIDDFPDVLEGITTIIIENDFLDDVEKGRVHGMFRAAGLVPVFERGINWSDRNGDYIPDFYQVWKAIPV